MAGFSALNYVNVGPNGTFRRSGNLHTLPADIDALFAHLQQTKARKLAIHFHGGLIDEGDGLEIARKMAPLYDLAGSHPVTFVWETGLFETIGRKLSRIYETKLFQKLVAHLLRQVEKHIPGVGGRGPGQAASLTEIEAELQRINKFQSYDARARGIAAVMNQADVEAARGEMQADLEAELEADAEFQELVNSGRAETEFLSPSVGQQTQVGTAKGFLNPFTYAQLLAMVGYAVLMRYVRKRDHGFYPTVVEEVLRELYLADFGAWVWSGMKEVAEEMWAANAGPITEDSRAGTYFLDKLSAHQKNNPGFVVDLIGHSAGSIAICHLFKAASQRAVPPSVRNVLFLAPACTSELFHQEIVSHPQRFKNFRMFTMQDAFEIEDQLVKGVYTRSLLYFISGVLEEDADAPLAGLERNMSGAAPYDAADLVAVAKWLKEAGKNRLVLSVASDGGAGLNSASLSHGNFDDDDPTRQSLSVIVAA